MSAPLPPPMAPPMITSRPPSPASRTKVLNVFFTRSQASHSSWELSERGCQAHQKPSGWGESGTEQYGIYTSPAAPQRGLPATTQMQAATGVTYPLMLLRGAHSSAMEMAALGQRRTASSTLGRSSSGG